MTVLHVLDHSLPVMSGYSTRSRNIVVFPDRLRRRAGKADLLEVIDSTGRYAQRLPP